MAIFLSDLTPGDAVLLARTLDALAQRHAPNEHIAQMVARLAAALDAAALASTAEAAVLEAARAWARADVAADVAADCLAQLVRADEIRIAALVKAGEVAVARTRPGPKSDLERRIDDASLYLDRMAHDENIALHKLHAMATELLPASERERKHRHEIADATPAPPPSSSGN